LAEYLYTAALIITCAAFIPAFVRLLAGPTSADRTVAVDVMTITAVSVMCLAALFSNRIVYLDTAFVYGLISFIGVVSIARYLERGL
jgi:multicomponent Na+:H+ antiporter subunit F